MAKRTTPRRPPAEPPRTGENEQEGWEDFERKRDWFLENREVSGDQSRTQLRLAALAQAEHMRLAASPEWAEKLRSDFDIVGPAKVKAATREEKAEGLLSQPVEVTPKSDEPALLRVSLKASKSKQVKPENVRMFRRGSKGGRWALVAESGVDPDGRFAWARIRRAGVYAPFGLTRGQSPAILAGSMMASDDVEAPEDDGPQRQLAFELARALGEPPAEIPDEGPEDLQADVRPPEIGWWKLGPRNINGRVKSLAIHPNNRHYLLAGAANGGVWRSTDGGASWNARWFNQLSMAVGAIAFAPSNPNRVYAATGEQTGGWGPSYGGAGVYRSNNAGGSWTLCESSPVSRLSKVLVHPTNPDIVYVSGDNGIWKSTTGGMGVGNWVMKKSGTLSDALLDPDFPDTLYVAQENTGLFKSIDGGDSWNPCNGSGAGASVVLPTGADAEWPKLAMGYRGNWKTRYIVVKMGEESGKLFYSTNGALSWLSIPGTHQPVRYNEWCNMVSVHPTHSKKMLCASVRMSRTINRFTWNDTSGTHSDHHQVVYDPVDPATVYVATDGGVYRSLNGGKDWHLRSFGMVATQLYGLGVSQSGALIIGCGTQDQGIIGLKPGSDLDWFDYGAGNEGGFFVVDPSENWNLYCCPWNHDLRRSTTGGASWTDIRNGMTDTHDGETTPLAAVHHLAVRPDNGKSLVAGGTITKKDADGNVVFTKTSIYRSLDRGDLARHPRITPIEAAVDRGLGCRARSPTAA